MGKRTKTTIVREIPDDTDERQERASDAIDNDIGEQSYSAFVGKFQGSQGCRVKVYRQTPRGRQYCFSGTPEEIESEETIRAYHAEQPYAHEEGSYVLYITVNGELRDPFNINIAPQIKAHIAGIPGASGGMAVDPTLRTLQEQMKRLEDRLLVQDRPPMLEMVDGLAKLDALRGGAGGGQMSLDTITRCIEIGTRMAGGGPSGDTGWEGMVRDVVKENAPALIGLFTMFTKKLQEPAQPPAQVIQPPAQPVQQPPAQPEETMKADEQERLIMQQALGWLKKKAVAHSDPGLYVDLIVDNREDPLYARLISQIVENDFPAFAAIDPDIEKPEFREFFSFIHDRIRRVFKPADTVATTGKRESGNKKNASGNGTTGKTGGE